MSYALNMLNEHIVIAYMSIESLSGKHGICTTFKWFVLQSEKTSLEGILFKRNQYID